MTYHFKSKQQQLFLIREVSWEQYHQALRAIRQSVFIEEQNVSVEEEWDGLDELPTTRHFIAERVTTNTSKTDDAAQTEASTIVATGRLLEDGKIGRMCVLQNFRGHGIGRALLNDILVDALHQQQHSSVYLYAQVSALDFYRDSGFIEEGETFLEANIEHQRMQLNLNDVANIAHICGNRVLRLNEINTFAFHLLTLIELGIQSIDIVSHKLSPQLFTQHIADAISKLARHHRQSRVRILVEDTKSLVGIHHPVVNISQRLSSSIFIRKLAQGAPEIGNEAYIIIDKEKLLFFNDESEFEGFVNYQAAAECKNILENFEVLWQQYGAKDPNLAQLHL